MVEKQAPRRDVSQASEQQAGRHANPPQMSQPIVPRKPPEPKKAPLEKACEDISNASMEIQKHANILNNAMISDRAMQSRSVRQHIERIIDNEEDRRQMREEIDELEAEAAHAEEAREAGDDEEMAETARDVRAGIDDLGAVAGAAEALRAAGAGPSVITALRCAARDMRAGETDAERRAFRERGHLAVDMARFYSEHLPGLRFAGMGPALQGLGRAIAALGRQAEEGTSAEAAGSAVRDTRALFTRMRRTVIDRARFARAAEAARLRDMSAQFDRLRPSIRDDGLRLEMGRLRLGLEDVLSRISRGERVSHQELRGLQGRTALLQDARQNLLAGRSGEQARTLEGMLGRALFALRGGNAEQSGAQMLMAQLFIRAGRELGEQIVRHSEALASGTGRIGASLQFLSGHFTSALEHFTGGSMAVRDGDCRSLLGRVLSGMNGPAQGVDPLQRASMALAAAERLSDAESQISRMSASRRPAASRVLGIFRRCLRTLAGPGSLDEAGIQLQFAGRHAGAAPQARASIERMSGRLMIGTNIRAMDRVLGARDLPPDPAQRRRAIVAAARDALGEGATEEDINALADSFESAGANSGERLDYADGIVRACSRFLSQLDRRSAQGRTPRRPPRGSGEREMPDRRFPAVPSRT